VAPDRSGKYVYSTVPQSDCCLASPARSGRFRSSRCCAVTALTRRPSGCAPLFMSTAIQGPHASEMETTRPAYFIGTCLIYGAACGSLHCLAQEVAQADTTRVRNAAPCTGCLVPSPWQATVRWFGADLHARRWGGGIEWWWSDYHHHAPRNMQPLRSSRRVSRRAGRPLVLRRFGTPRWCCGPSRQMAPAAIRAQPPAPAAHFRLHYLARWSANGSMAAPSERAGV
jgi:hypothetical protein